jgi:hypothetical protein
MKKIIKAILTPVFWLIESVMSLGDSEKIKLTQEEKNGFVKVVVSPMMLILIGTLLLISIFILSSNNNRQKKEAMSNSIEAKLDSIIDEQRHQREVLDRLYFDYYCYSCHDTYHRGVMACPRKMEVEK